MVQQTQPVTNKIQQPVVPAKQPAVAQPAVQMQPEEKTSILKKWWFWLIFVVAITGASVGIYFLLK